MIAPISGDKISSQQSESSNQDRRVSDSNGQSGARSSQATAPSQTPNTDSVSVSGSGKVMSEKASAAQATRQIEDAPSALELAKKIGQQLKESGGSGLQFYSMDKNQAADLLALSHG